MGDKSIIFSLSLGSLYMLWWSEELVLFWAKLETIGNPDFLNCVFIVCLLACFKVTNLVFLTGNDVALHRAWCLCVCLPLIGVNAETYLLTAVSLHVDGDDVARAHYLFVCTHTISLFLEESGLPKLDGPAFLAYSFFLLLIISKGYWKTYVIWLHRKDTLTIIFLFIVGLVIS